MTYDEQVELLGRVNALEAEGRHREAIALCEGALDGAEIPEFNLALARNHYAIAVRGNEVHAWPAVLAAFDGIAKRCEQQPDVVHALGICRWVLGLFADPHRLDAKGFAYRHAAAVPVDRWWGARPEPADPDAPPPPRADLARVEHLLAGGQHVRAANALLAAAPPAVRHAREPEGVAREARYLLATLLAALDGDQVAGLLAADEFPPPGDHDAQHYDRYLLTAAGVRREQLRARAAGAPGIVIASLPKSASEFLSYTLAEALRAPVLRVTIGPPPLGTVHGKWVAAVLEGGAVTHDHFAASAANLAALKAGGLNEIWVLVRDPRAAFWSYERMQSEYDGVAAAARMDPARVLHGVKQFGDWVATWVTARDDGFPVRFVYFRDLTESPGPVMGRILQSRGGGRFVAALNDVLQVRAEGGRVSSNFRQGDDEAWRAGVPAELHAAIWDAVDERAKKLLGLKP
ncbi:hypothetical protein [Gemmata sp.]|uniref:hypothetical protein n=1 Tax=Gemmata sp. TaxID=1914242 RepID=UPI003F7299E1